MRKLIVIFKYIYILYFVIIYYKRLVNVAKEAFNIDLKPRNAVVYSLLMYIPFYSWYLSVKNHNKVIGLYNECINSGTGEKRQTIEEYYRKKGLQPGSGGTSEPDGRFVKKDTGTKDVVRRPPNPEKTDTKRKGVTNDSGIIMKVCNVCGAQNAVHYTTEICPVCHNYFDGRTIGGGSASGGGSTDADPGVYTPVDKKDIKPTDDIIDSIAESGLDF